MEMERRWAGALCMSLTAVLAGAGAFLPWVSLPRTGHIRYDDLMGIDSNAHMYAGIPEVVLAVITLLLALVLLLRGRTQFLRAILVLDGALIVAVLIAFALTTLFSNESLVDMANRLDNVHQPVYPGLGLLCEASAGLLLFVLGCGRLES